MKHVLFHSLSNPLQPRRRIGVAIGEHVLDVSAVAPLFFTGPTLGPQQQVRHMLGKVKVSGACYMHNTLNQSQYLDISTTVVVGWRVH